MDETSTKPYLIRALHEWCTDNNYTPYIVVHVDEQTIVPMGHVQDSKITLNVGTLATNGLKLGNDYIEFQARFGGRPENVAVHIGAISAIYSRETGAGMGFEIQPYDSASRATANTGLTDVPALVSTTIAVVPMLGITNGGRADDAPDNPSSNAKRPLLTIVK